jgi:hypothetical protein
MGKILKDVLWSMIQIMGVVLVIYWILQTVFQ